MTESATNASRGIGYIDGEYMPHSELRIPVTDLGFQLSDMCYDALHVWKGRFFRADAHMDRWERSIAERRFDTLGVDREGTMEILGECVRRAGLREAMVYVVATRGSPGSAFKDLRTCKNRLIAWAVPYYAVVSEAEMRDGCDIIVSKVERIPPSSVDPTVKNFGRLDFCDALFEAYDRGAKYAVLVDRDGNVTEGRGWNIFGLFGGRLVSPDAGVLQGVTRRTVLELCDKLNVTGELAPLSAADLARADEVFITSTAGGIMPVRRIDDAPVATGSPGPVTRRLTELYWSIHEDDAYTAPVAYGD
jgi:branched-chain amino acid aminotransferase